MPVEGNSRLIYAAVQTDKATPATDPTHVFRLSGDGALNPNRELIRLPSTDGSSQRPNNVVVGSSPAGGFSFWMQASLMAFVARGIQGSNADSGSNPNYTHTATPAKTLPYHTFWDVIPGVQCTQYNAVRMSQLAMSGEALQGIQATLDVVALEAVLGATEPTLPSAPATDLEYTYPLVVCTVGGSAPGTYDAWSLTINRNVIILRGDNGLEAFDSFAGAYEVDGTFRKIYVDDDDYRKMHGGSTSATVLTTTIATDALDILIAENANRSVRITSSGIEYTSIEVPVNVDGAPILETLAFSTKRQATWANNCTVVTKNGLATPSTSPT